MHFASIFKTKAQKVEEKFGGFGEYSYICSIITISLLKLTNMEGKAMGKNPKMYNEEEYELDNQYNDEDRFVHYNVSIWYN